MSMIRNWLPEGMDVDITSAMTSAGLAKWIPYAMFFGTLVTKRSLDLDEAGEFSEMGVGLLRIGIPKNHLPRIKSALVPDCIETDGTFRFGELGSKSLGYRLAPKYQTRQVRRHKVESSELAKKLATHEVKRRARLELMIDEMPYWYRGIYDGMMSHYLRKTDETRESPISDHLFGPERRWFSVCEHGRVHHPICNVPSHLRHQIRRNGANQPLALTDIRSSQPLLVGLLTANPTLTDQHRPPAGRRTQHTARRRTPTPTPPATPTVGTITLAPYSGGCTFIDDCLSGRLYSRLREAINDGSAGRMGWWTEGEVKTGVLACIYDEPDRFRTSKVGRAMFAVYPDFAPRIEDLAFRMKDVGGHGYFPCLMQRIESDVMIHGVAKALMDTGIDSKPTSIHDAFLIRQDDAPAVEEVIRKQWRMRLGVEPGIKTTVCR